MLTPENFDRNEGVILTPYEFSDEQIAQATEGLPEWLPVEYKQFFKNFGDFKAPGFTLYSPLYSPQELYFISTGYRRFQEIEPPLTSDPGNWIPIGHYDGFSYAVYHRLDSGRVEIGSYDFESDAYFNGPFSTLEDWINSYAK